MKLDINQYRPGDYVESLVDDYYPRSIWVVYSKSDTGYFSCGNAFYITRHDGGNLLLSRSIYGDGPVWLHGSCIMLADMGLIGEAKLRGLHVPGLPEKKRRP